MINPQERWPWIKHFPGSKNEEGMEHPGSWKVPTKEVFKDILLKMDKQELEKLIESAWNSLGKHELYQRQGINWRRSAKIKNKMFDIWVNQEGWAHRDLENKYFAPSRKRDSEAFEKAMKDPETLKMRLMVISRDNAEILGEPWFPDKE
jgi:hypothetical protein